MIKDKIDYGIAVKRLNEATKKYDEGHPIMSDKEWDDLYFDVVKFENNTGIYFTDSPTHSISFDVRSKLNKVKHNHPMLSLDKTKSITDIVDFLGGNAGIIMSKMDGLTCSLRYVQGRLISAETRGDGMEGEDILHNIVHAHGIPYYIKQGGDIVIDGEVICTYNDFEEFKEEYKNPRNFASGSIRLLDSKESANRNLTFVAWDCISPIANTLSEKLTKLKELGFIVVPYSTNVIDIETEIDKIKQESFNLSYPIDGVVFKYDVCKYYESLGNTDHHFRGGLAYKFYDETVSTKLRAITYEVSRSGRMNPVANFDTVEIDGTRVSRASLHNLTIMREILGDKPWVGQELEVYKANMIIPQVYSANKIDDEKTKYYIELPKICPSCGEELIIKKDGVAEELCCSNIYCPSRLADRLTHYCSKPNMNIEGLSEQTIANLMDFGWLTEFKDIYSLEEYRDTWIETPGYSDVSVDKLLTAINKSRNTTLERFIAAIGIPNIGYKQAKLICSICNSWDDFINKVNNNFDWSVIEGFGEKKSEAINNFNYDEADACIKYLTFISNRPVKNTSTSLNDLIFVITGSVTTYKNRNELKEFIESNGGKVADAVNKNTNYLINNDVTSMTSKNKKAKELKVPIITEFEFNNMFKGNMI